MGEGEHAADSMVPKPKADDAHDAESSVLPPEIAEKLPKGQREVFEFMAATMSGPMPNPLLKQITPEHISALLASQERSDDRHATAFKHGLDDRRNNRYVVFAAFCVGLLFLIVAYVLVPTDRLSLLNDIVKVLVGALLGAMGGYGLGRSKAKSQDD